MANTILLCSETFVKNNTNIDDNINSKIITSAIREAQEVSLREILGDNLLDKLLLLVENKTIDSTANSWYKSLIKECQYFLAYTAISNICMITSVKISNSGLEQVSDEHMQPISIADSYRMQDFYSHKADFYCNKLQNFVLANRTHYPELNESCLHKIHSNLYSSANTGLWLGGVRGNLMCKKLYRKNYKNYR